MYGFFFFLTDAINYLIPSSPPHTKFKQNIEADVPFEENNITIKAHVKVLNKHVRQEKIRIFILKLFRKKENNKVILTTEGSF